MILTLLSTALAQSIDVTLDPTWSQSLGLSEQEMENAFSAAAGADLRLDDQAQYITSMARAAALSARGLGVDYASNPQRFVVGGGFGTAVSGAGAQFGRGDALLPEGGFAFQVAAMAGLNLGVFASEESFARRFVLYANGMALSTNGDPLSGDLQNLGAHLQVQLVRPKGTGKPVEWGGMALTGGWEQTSYTTALSADIPQSVQQDGYQIDWDATGSYTIEAETESFPIELSTNLRILLLNVYGGAALDIASASASSVIKLEGPLSVQLDGSGEPIGSATIELGDNAGFEAYVPRVFVGSQVEILVIKIYGHLNVGLDDSFGGHLGARVAL